MYMKRLFFVLFAMVGVLSLSAQNDTFARGADISWCTEMEADGMKFYNTSGQETELFQLMRQIGMNAVRLRVWVNPENGYGPWCDKADVLVKARRAKAAGLNIMIDFHYSDYFADPGRQTRPAAWNGLSFDAIKTALANHTRDVLQALKDEGIEPLWVQVGNETTSGMVWPEGQIDWSKSESQRWLNYVALSNAGYDAVKSVLPNAYVIVHHDNAQSDNVWYYEAFKKYGGKLDMIGLSHYPDWDQWSQTNTAAATNLRKLYNKFHLPVMIVETGYSTWDEPRAESVMKDLFSKMDNEPGCAGILYWEPEVYGGWEARLLQNDGTWSTKTMGTVGKRVGSKGAFTPYGQPTAALLAFADDADGIRSTDEERGMRNEGREVMYDLSGRRILNHPSNGIYITGNKKVLKK